MENKLSLYEAVEYAIKTTIEFYEKGSWEDVNAYLRLKDLSNFLKLTEREIRSSGYIVHTLEAALWCLLNTNTFAECILKAVNLGDDTDTVGAVVGGLAGIYYGTDQIPKEWLTALAKRQYIEELCIKFQMLE